MAGMTRRHQILQRIRVYSYFIDSGLIPCQPCCPRIFHGISTMVVLECFREIQLAQLVHRSCLEVSVSAKRIQDMEFQQKTRAAEKIQAGCQDMPSEFTAPRVTRI